MSVSPLVVALGPQQDWVSYPVIGEMLSLACVRRNQPITLCRLMVDLTQSQILAHHG